ncbi:hypothetical protein CRG98_021009 [Punica granatum]|uniref:Uncharacterized protein n=1 Tax=Punica granatum TaxID=22663 RepID=A0A2I0JRW0_PUNGR|nr:hypothetical protein CRG98_021009 [Punica granatum]
MTQFVQDFVVVGGPKWGADKGPSTLQGLKGSEDQASAIARAHLEGLDPSRLDPLLLEGLDPSGVNGLEGLGLRSSSARACDLICDLISFLSSINGEVLLLRSHCSFLRAPRIVRRSASDLALPCSQARRQLHSHHLPFEAHRFADSCSCQCASWLDLILAVAASLGCGSSLFPVHIPLPFISISVLTCKHVV